MRKDNKIPVRALSTENMKSKAMYVIVRKRVIHAVGFSIKEAWERFDETQGFFTIGTPHWRIVKYNKRGYSCKPARLVDSILDLNKIKEETA